MSKSKMPEWLHECIQKASRDVYETHRARIAQAWMGVLSPAGEEPFGYGYQRIPVVAEDFSLPDGFNSAQLRFPESTAPPEVDKTWGPIGWVAWWDLSVAGVWVATPTRLTQVKTIRNGDTLVFMPGHLQAPSDLFAPEQPRTCRQRLEDALFWVLAQLPEVMLFWALVYARIIVDGLFPEAVERYERQFQPRPVDEVADWPPWKGGLPEHLRIGIESTPGSPPEEAPAEREEE